MRDIILTIDIGTGSTRSGLVNDKGEIIGFAQREYDQISPRPGWAEQRPSLWWQSVCQCVQEVLSQHAECRGRLAAVSVCGQMHGTVLLDADGHLAIDSALLWNDKRSQPLVEQFSIGHDVSSLLATLNNPPTAAWPAFKMDWLRQNLPDVWQRVATVLMPKDYVNFMLAGVRATDYSEASCYYLMDCKTLQWSEHALKEFDFSLDLLPQLHLSSDVIGEVSREASLATGIPEGVPVVAGAADMAATLLGSGTHQPGTASDSTGTSTLLTVVAEEPLLHPLINNLHLANSAWGGFTILDAGGDAMRWARQALGGNRLSHQELLTKAESSPPGAEGLIFLPYLTGERLARKTNSRASFFGLHRGHREEHLYRAVLEGVAYAATQNLRQLQQSTGGRVEKMIASGGGARSPLWLKIKASLYNLPIIQTRNQENGVTGCAIIGGTGIGLFSDFADGITKTVQFEQEIIPDPRLHELYIRRFELFEDLYTTAQPFYDRLDALNSVALAEDNGVSP